MEVTIFETHTITKETVVQEEYVYQPRTEMMIFSLQSIFRNHQKPLRKYAFNMLRCLFKEYKREGSEKSSRASSKRRNSRVKRSFYSSRSVSPSSNSTPQKRRIQIHPIARVLSSLAEKQYKAVWDILTHWKGRNFMLVSKEFRGVKNYAMWDSALRGLDRLLNSKLLSRYKVGFARMNIQKLALPFNCLLYTSDAADE